MLKTIIAVMTISGQLLLTAAPAAIGFVKSDGDFRIDGSGIHGNSTLFEGNVVETTNARSSLQLAGTLLTLMPESRAQVYRDHVVLEKGASLATSLQSSKIDAASIYVVSSSKQTKFQVELTSPTRVVIAASSGTAQVWNRSGVLVANVAAGTARAFETGTGGAASAVTLDGELQARDGKFFLTDKTANITVELQGDDLQKYAGKPVEVTGSVVPGAPAAGGASQVVHAATVSLLKGKRAGAVGSGAAAGSAGSGSGISATTVGIIVGGVGVGGTVGGLAAAGAFSGSSSVSPK